MARLGLSGIALLSDPELQVIGAWGVKMKGAELAVPATFIVRRDATIVWRYIGETQADRPSAEELLEQVRSLAPEG